MAPNPLRAASDPSSQTNASPAPLSPRLPYIDNIRWTIVVLVISMHAADTYSPLGSWYYTDRAPLSAVSLVVLAAWQMYLQAFFMGLLFFIAGYFVPAAYVKRGAPTFLRDRAIRLGIPVLLYMFVIGPITEYFCAHSWTSTEPTTFTNEWIKHIRNGQFLQENGPLWFCLVLLIFCAAYTALKSLLRSDRTRPLAGSAPTTRVLLAFALVMAIGTFAGRLYLPPGARLLNVHLGDLPQYVLMFAAGLHASRSQWVQTFDPSSGLRWLAIVVPAGFVLWLAVVLFGGALSGHSDLYAGGWHWQAASINAWESFTCVGLSYGVLALFRTRFPSQGAVARFLSANAFAVYVFHPPIVIIVARALHSLAWPAIARTLLLTVLAALISFVSSAMILRRVPGLRNVL